MAQRRKWSAAVKFEIALLAIKNETTLNEICRRYGVAPSLVTKWKKQLLEHGANLFVKEAPSVNAVVTELEHKQNKLYEKIGQLTVERDFLKKSWGKLRGNGDED